MAAIAEKQLANFEAATDATILRVMEQIENKSVVISPAQGDFQTTEFEFPDGSVLAISHLEDRMWAGVKA